MNQYDNFPTYVDNVWLYLRKSREDREAEERARREGKNETETLSRHRHALLELAHKYHHNITQILEEVISGEFISERPEIQRLLEAVDNGEVDAVWVMDIDRLGRGDMADQGAILRTFKDSCTLIMTPDKVYDLNNEMDEEWTEFKTFFARRELKMINKRLQRGRIASVKEGKYIGTRPPFGYDVNHELVLEPNQDADTMRMIFELYVNKGLGCGRIANYLNSIGIKSPMGKIWRSESVIALIRNPVYAGYICWRKLKQDKRKHSFRKRPESEWIKATGKHEALIDEVTYQRSVEIRSRRNHAPIPRNLKASSPLTSVIQCGKCGEKMVKRPYMKQQPHIICKNPTCPQRSTRLDIVESRVIKELQEWLSDYKLNMNEIASAIAPSHGPLTQYEKILTDINNQIKQLDVQRDNLHNLLERGIYDDATYIDRNKRLMTELNSLHTKQQTIEKELQKLLDAHDAKYNIIPLMTNVLDAYHATDDVAEKNKLLKSILEKAVYNKEKWQRGDQFELTLYPLI